MKKAFRKYDSPIAGIAVLAFFVFALAAVHDMQQAEGVGLYFALKLGGERLVFDVIVDILAAAGLLLLISMPCLILKHRRITSLLRFAIVFFSFMPTLSMAYLIHPSQESFLIKTPLLGLQIILPLLCLLAAAVFPDEKGRKKWYGVCGMAVVLLFAVTLFVPSLQQLLNFIWVYLLLLICFDLWERMYRRYSSLNTWGWILFGGLAFRAIYVLSEILRRY